MVIFGDSITAWNPRKDVINIGVPGDSTRDMLWRIEAVRGLTDERVVFMGGINDILMGIRREKIAENLEKIAGILKGTFKEVVFISLLPIKGSEKRKAEILEVNRMIGELVGKMGLNYVDCHSEFSDGEGELRDIYTTDGIHLSTHGYEVLNSIIDR